MNDFKVYSSAALFGALAGMRSMAAPAMLGQLSRGGSLDGVTGALALVRRPGFVTASSLLAVTELIADKLPFTPNRTAAGPLLGRAFACGISGAVICSSKRRSVFAGALIGAAAAVGIAYATFKFRQQAVRKTHVPDAVIALAEDAAVGVLSAALVSTLNKSNRF